MEGKSFFGSLFDFSFSSFITPKIIKILFVIGLILTAIFTLFLIIFAFIGSIASGVVVLIFSPVIFLLYVLAVRIYLELLIVIFRIQGDIAKIAEHTKD
jgi:hypothetical protein